MRWQPPKVESDHDHLHMCLMLVASSAPNGREDLNRAALDAAETGLRVELDRPSRWSWPRYRPVRAAISEEGGCACSLLSDEADWNADVWAMRPEILEPLARTLEILAQNGPLNLAIEAVWVGEKARKTTQVTPSELAQLVRSNGLGTRTKYVIVRQ